jgi:DNA replicative helicase MCM subunit Mcm2 (Cdc46/Mcm family)
VILEHDLVDRAKPGDRIVSVGVYRTLPASQQYGQTTGLFRTVLMCNNVSIIGKEIGAVQLTGTDIKNIRYACRYIIAHLSNLTSLSFVAVSWPNARTCST